MLFAKALFRYTACVFIQAHADDNLKTTALYMHQRVWYLTHTQLAGFQVCLGRRDRSLSIGEASSHARLLLCVYAKQVSCQ